MISHAEHEHVTIEGRSVLLTDDEDSLRGRQGMRAATGQLRVGAQEPAASPGERSFKAVCMACHARDRRLVGPPVTEKLIKLKQTTGET